MQVGAFRRSSIDVVTLWGSVFQIVSMPPRSNAHLGLGQLGLRTGLTFGQLANGKPLRMNPHAHMQHFGVFF